MSAYRFAVIALILVFAGCGDSHGNKNTLQATQWEPIDLVLDRAVVESNPFDPAQIEVNGDFRSPGGEVLTIPGFVSRDYARSLVGGFEKLAAMSDLQWKIRFAATEPGT